eukprot:IDg3676t1
MGSLPMKEVEISVFVKNAGCALNWKCTKSAEVMLVSEAHGVKETFTDLSRCFGPISEEVDALRRDGPTTVIDTRRRLFLINSANFLLNHRLALEVTEGSITMPLVTEDDIAVGGPDGLEELARDPRNLRHGRSCAICLTA